jgi:hypothetical protein
MRQITKDVVKKAATFVAGTLLGKGILLSLSKLGIFPEQWVASALGLAYANLDAIAWTLAGTIGLLILVAWEIVSRRSAAPAVLAPVAHKTPCIAGAGRIEAAPMHDVWLQDAVCYALHSRWLGENEQAFGPEHLTLVDQIAQQMRELGGSGEYVIWGKFEPTSLHVKIPPEFWVDNQIEILRLIGHTAENVCTERATHGHSFTRYAALRVNRAQTEKMWPPPREITLIETL